MLQQPQLQFSISFQAPVWNMVLDHDSSLLIIETRDGATRQVSFSAVDLNNHQLLWKDFGLTNTWWTGVIGVYEGVMLLHQYTDSQQPQPKGIRALDVRNKQMLWQQPNWTFYTIHTNELIVYTVDSQQLPVYHKVDLLSGSILPAIPDQPSQSTFIKNEDIGLTYPTHYPEDSPYFQAIAQFMEKKIGQVPIKAFDYAEYQGLVIVSYYLREQQTMCNQIVVLNAQAVILLQETMATQLTGIGLNTFMLRNGSLIFVREKKELLSYAL